MAATVAGVLLKVQVLPVELRRMPSNLSLALPETTVGIPFREPLPLPAGGILYSPLMGKEAAAVVGGALGVLTLSRFPAVGHPWVTLEAMDTTEVMPLSFCLLNVDILFRLYLF